MVKFRSLEWSGDFAHTSVGVMFHLTEYDGLVILERIQNSSTIKSSHETRDEAKYWAQVKFERLMREHIIES